MKIQYLGHSCFRIISEINTAIICDPYKADMVGFSMPKLSCDLVTVSHRHHDHDCVEEVAGNPPLLEGDVRLAADDIAIETFQCYHDDRQGKLRGKNTVFCFLVDGLKIVHMGDVGELNNELSAKIYGCDVLMLPVGGIFTIDSDGANWYVQHVQPKIVIPMHYKTARHAFEIDGVENFLKLQNSKNVHRLSNETLVLNDSPENTEPQIYVLEPYIE